MACDKAGNDRELSMRVLGATAALVLVAAVAGSTGPARAQSGGGGNDSPHVNLLADQPSKTPEEKEADLARERAYKESLKKIPDAKAPSDPWGSVRTDSPKASAKAATAAKTKTKTGNNAN
jgi:hypothetical protein